MENASRPPLPCAAPRRTALPGSCHSPWWGGKASRHRGEKIFYNFGCSFLHVYQGDFLRGSPRASARPDEWHKTLVLGAVRHAVKGFTHRDYLVINLDTALVAISCEHQNLARTVTVRFWDCRRRSRVPFTPFVNAPSAVCSSTVKKYIVQQH